MAGLGLEGERPQGKEPGPKGKRDRRRGGQSPPIPDAGEWHSPGSRRQGNRCAGLVPRHLDGTRSVRGVVQRGWGPTGVGPWGSQAEKVGIAKAGEWAHSNLTEICSCEIVV